MTANYTWIEKRCEWCGDTFEYAEQCSEQPRLCPDCFREKREFDTPFDSPAAGGTMR